MNEYDIVKFFPIDGEVQSINPFGEGHINSTFLVTTDKNKYTLQKINTNVFKNPQHVMDNIYYVTSHLEQKGSKTLKVVKTNDGKLMHNTENGCYRLYEFIDNVLSYQNVPDKSIFVNVGEAFGEFQNILADFDASKLHETIKDFHNTPKRFCAFKEAVDSDVKGRLESCREEVQFVLDRKDTLDKVVKGLEEGKIPLRVTHNDTKLNNILMHPETNKAVAVIDLDTVMPGSMLYDFGDAIRSGSNTAAEDEKNVELVKFDIELFKSFAKGFCNELGKSMTETEKELLAYSAYLMTMECGIRFLTDYLSGDTYFATKYPEHNLVRCRTQFKLVSEMEKVQDEMEKIIKACF